MSALRDVRWGGAWTETLERNQVSQLGEGKRGREEERKRGREEERTWRAVYGKLNLNRLVRGCMLCRTHIFREDVK